MKKKNPFFLIKAEAFRIIWLANFASKLPSYRVLFGIPQEWVDEIVAGNALLVDVYKILVKLEDQEQLLRAFKDGLFDQTPNEPNVLLTFKSFSIAQATDLTSLPNIFSRAISVAQMILDNPLCTKGIIEDLKLEKPTETEIVNATGRSRKPVVGDAPVLDATVAGDIVTLNITKGKKFNKYIANVFVSRTDTEPLSFLTATIKRSIKDRASFGAGVQYVTYTYQVQMMDGDEAVGKASKPLIVVVPRPVGTPNVG